MLNFQCHWGEKSTFIFSFTENKLYMVSDDISGILCITMLLTMASMDRVAAPHRKTRDTAGIQRGEYEILNCPAQMLANKIKMSMKQWSEPSKAKFLSGWPLQDFVWEWYKSSLFVDHRFARHWTDDSKAWAFVDIHLGHVGLHFKLNAQCIPSTEPISHHLHIWCRLMWWLTHFSQFSGYEISQSRDRSCCWKLR